MISSSPINIACASFWDSVLTGIGCKPHISIQMFHDRVWAKWGFAEPPRAFACRPPRTCEIPEIAKSPEWRHPRNLQNCEIPRLAKIPDIPEISKIAKSPDLRNPWTPQNCEILALAKFLDIHEIPEILFHAAVCMRLGSMWLIRCYLAVAG